MFEDQVSIAAQLTTILYIVGVIAIMLALVGVILFDAGLSRPGNVMHTMVQKLVAAFVAAAGMSVIGFAIWDWQFNQAFGVPNGLSKAIESWWLGGSNINTLPQNLDPAVVPGADSYHAFFAIFIVFAAFLAALLAGAVIERVKTTSLAVVALVFGALVIPFGGYLVYGPVGPLSNAGTHDFGGSFFYILLGCWALVLVWRAKPRVGVFSGTPPAPHNLVYTVVGMVLFLAGICGYVLVNGFLVPDVGYFGITLNESGMGLIVTNLMMAFAASALGGLVTWKVSKNPYFFLIAPVSGWIGVAGLIDVVKPWQAGVTALFAPLVVLGGYKVMNRLGLDDPKVVPLTLGPGIYSALMTAVFASGVKQGGFFGLEGDYAFQHASIGVVQQLIGVGVFLALGLVSALIVVTAVEKTVGLRDKRVDDGLDGQLDRVVIGLTAYPERTEVRRDDEPIAVSLVR
ncbi:ammonium transporter [Antrihabitans sp. YC2-6]|uniref:ammonium transporter n=1 Tax=Antrihabitans sp. YC2-6 TaxID=2799498 RepID=UPI0018F50E94|nr:ammonium transporter [Antrihabitans sp. YC2-6]MBJ8348858.1 ammonium transporter [Antrihabitans sp. YC2-6]